MPEMMHVVATPVLREGSSRLSLGDALRELDSAHIQRLLTEAEYSRARGEIISSFTGRIRISNATVVSGSQEQICNEISRVGTAPAAAAMIRGDAHSDALPHSNGEVSIENSNLVEALPLETAMDGTAETLPRAQCGESQYQQRVAECLETNLHLHQGDPLFDRALTSCYVTLLCLPNMVLCPLHGLAMWGCADVVDALTSSSCSNVPCSPCDPN
eukprot:CAMPEP_0171767910 /NCGR_PEP_ID=MMETSP0991-20121206/52097_1 /TAXON_ID=483369 /ORGANISM="non described non described, Strain CCMP2098" /LENGTH=214 /DNA_ID=CAMNT_0012372783 /DNA_START=140 /DNA_END=781 /DNA_ORIENTATION=+